MTKTHHTIQSYFKPKDCTHKIRENCLLKLLRPMAILLWLTITSSGICFGADISTVSGSPDDSRIIQRVQLVGVIADTSAANAGIAVIKDTVTGRSYAIRTGESLPGVSHIVMTHVQREGVEFTANNQKYTVRPILNGTSGNEGVNVADQEAQTKSENIDTNEEDVGLFEKWASGSPEFSSEAISLEAIKTLQKKFDALDKDDKSTGITRLNDASAADGNPTSDEWLQDDVIYEDDEPEDD